MLASGDYVTRFWENDKLHVSQNQTNTNQWIVSYTTIPLVQTLSITQTTEGWL